MCDLEALFQCLQDIASHLHHEQTQRLELQAQRLKSLEDISSPGYIVDEDGRQEIPEFLRGAVGVANTFTAFSAALPGDPAHPPVDAALVARLPAIVWQATCASFAVDRLLGCLRVALASQIEVPPDVIFRLVAACGVTLGPGITAAHLAYQYVAAYLQPAAQVQAAGFLLAVCTLLLGAARQAEAVLQLLGDAKPAAALRATACRPGHFVELCCKAVPILHWSSSLLGPCRSQAAVLTHVSAYVCREFAEALESGDDQLRREHASLAVTYVTFLAQQLERMPLTVGGSQLPWERERWTRGWVYACSMLAHSNVQTQPEAPQAAGTVAGTLLRLLQLHRAGANLPTFYELLATSIDALSGLNTGRLGQQQRQQQQQLLPACLQWAAVGAAALAAMADAYVEGAARTVPAATDALRAQIMCQEPLLERLALGLASWQDAPEQMPPEATAAAVAACEAVLRLCGTLLRVLSNAQCPGGSSLASAAATLYSRCTHFARQVAQTCNRALS